MKTDDYKHQTGCRPMHCKGNRSGGGGRRRAPGSPWRTLAVLLIAITLAGLTACGGGGDGSVEPPEPDSEDVFLNDRQTSGCTLLSE